MYNTITLIVQFHCPTCFEPLIWVHLQGLIVSNHTLFTPTGTIVYIVKYELFTIVLIHFLKQIKGENCSCWLSTVLTTQQATNSDKQDIKTAQIIQLLYNF
jgi:hypothetical protein